jgi:hypothetical protein
MRDIYLLYVINLPLESLSIKETALKSFGQTAGSDFVLYNICYYYYDEAQQAVLRFPFGN